MSWIYVLQCEDDYFYVGRTINIPERWMTHSIGCGAEWTKLHRPKAIVDLRNDSRFMETTTTLEYMNRYGIEKVRGAQWSNIMLTQAQKDAILACFRNEGFGRKEDHPMHNITPMDEDKPSRVGHKWDADEEGRLIQEMNNATHLFDIARAHGRTESAIRAHVAIMVRELAKEKSPEEVSGHLNLTMDDIKLCLYGGKMRIPEMANYLRI
jgi:predicted GIY-YIG superfamily endonuclease